MYNGYGRNSSNPVLDFFHGSVVRKMVAANVLVFILQLLLSGTSFLAFFALFPRLVVTRGYIWQLVTYMFLHGDLAHIALNMLIIWMFGSALERTWGSQRFLKFYFVCGLGGALASFIFSYNSVVLGASGAGYGILLAYAVLFPYNQIYVWGIFPVRARTLVIVLAIIEFLRGISGGTGIAHFAHLGGMAAGLIYMRTDHRAWKFHNKLRSIWSRFPLKVHFDGGKGNVQDGENSRSSESDKIDSILDKISSKGYDNLTETEKRILDNYSRDREKN